MQEVSALLGVSPAHVNQQCRRHGITTANYPSIIEVQRERQGQSSDKWSPEAKSKHSAYMSERNREMWQDPEMKERIAAKISEAIANGRYGRSPNNLESFFDEITSDDVRFVGDGSWWRKIDNRHRNPDFKVTGQPKVIELFGDYWHRDDDPEQVVKEYASAGLACLVFWESEVYEQTEDVLRRTEEFIAS
ncbi:MAG: hypothetical protein Q8Q52_01315 [Acidimicrobiia bacterium]|nr:hypothetical protein [Acidimicrobiia bacterium]